MGRYECRRDPVLGVHLYDTVRHKTVAEFNTREACEEAAACLNAVGSHDPAKVAELVRAAELFSAASHEERNAQCDSSNYRTIVADADYASGQLQSAAWRLSPAPSSEGGGR